MWRKWEKIFYRGKENIFQQRTLRGLNHQLAPLHFDPVTLSLSLSLCVALCVKFSNILRRKIKYENRLDFEALQKKLLSGAENIGLFLSWEIRIQAEL